MGDMERVGYVAAIGMFVDWSIFEKNKIPLVPRATFRGLSVSEWRSRAEGTTGRLKLIYNKR